MKKIRITIFLATLLFNISIFAASKEIGFSKPEKQGFSSDRLSKITKFMERKVQDGTMVGGMGLIARNGRIVYQESYGMADREAGREMKSDDIFRIFSMTKSLTSVALMVLYEEGRFRLDDPIAWYLPEFSNLEVV